jgi:hypothetical protein
MRGRVRRDRIHIYDTPLQVLAALLAVGFLLTLLVRPLRSKSQLAETSVEMVAGKA